MPQGNGGNGHGDASPGPVADNVRSRRFELVDAKGEVRAVLGTQVDSGAPGFLVSDSAGRPRIALHVSPDDTPAFDLLDATGAPRVHVALGTDGAPVLTLFGPTEKPAQALLTVTSDGAAHLRLAQGDGHTRLFCSLQPDGTPYLVADGRGRAAQALVRAARRQPRPPDAGRGGPAARGHERHPRGRAAVRDPGRGRPPRLDLRAPVPARPRRILNAPRHRVFARSPRRGYNRRPLA